ncbi:SalX ABC-type antimicrobial peptide transport system, ATPase component [Burkholderiales bacterium]
MESVPTVAIRNLRFGWPKQPSLLCVEAFDIAAGEMVLLQGPSGCGKTTLLGLIAGVIAARPAGVRLLGHELASLGASERDRLRGEQMGVIFQQFNLLPFLSVMDNVLLPTRLFAPRREAAIAAHGDPPGAARYLLGKLGLTSDLETRAVAQLSVGQQQRVAAARALIGAPRLIIADEPTSALDEHQQAEFLSLLIAQTRSSKATLCMVSHQRGFASLFDRTVEFSALNSLGHVV